LLPLDVLKLSFAPKICKFEFLILDLIFDPFLGVFSTKNIDEKGLLRARGGAVLAGFMNKGKLSFPLFFNTASLKFLYFVKSGLAIHIIKSDNLTTIPVIQFQ
jgi:hypothetical protein